MKPLNLFLLLTFLLFIVGFGITGLLISTGSPDYLVVLAQIVMAWTPTMAFAIIHRKSRPGQVSLALCCGFIRDTYQVITPPGIHPDPGYCDDHRLVRLLSGLGNGAFEFRCGSVGRVAPGHVLRQPHSRAAWRGTGMARFSANRTK